MPENYKWNWNLAFKLADKLDHMAGTGDMEAEIVYRYFLGGYTHEQTAAELDIPVEMSQKIAAEGLKKLKDSAFGSSSTLELDKPSGEGYNQTGS